MLKVAGLVGIVYAIVCYDSCSPYDFACI